MAWTVDELLRWLDEIEPRIDLLDHFTWLGLKPAAPYEQLQPAFHAVARTRHPDLFRTRIDAAAMDRLVRVYARITSAYAELRDPARYEELARPLRSRVRTPQGSRAPQVARTPTPGAQVSRVGTSPQVSRVGTSPQLPRPAAPQVSRTRTAPVEPSVARTQTPVQVQRTTTQPRPATEPPADAAAPELEPSRAMNPRALAYYRRAEGALRVGDRVTALLQLRMALASDPTSQLLRAALAELLAQR